MRSARSPSLESQSSFERLQQLAKKEGKSARNLVAWSVPAAEEARGAGGSGRERGKMGARRRNSGEKLSRSQRMCRAAADQLSGSGLGEGKGEARGGSKADVQARYWRYLFDNLFRAVDELYRTCEADSSVLECQVGCRGWERERVCVCV